MRNVKCKTGEYKTIERNSFYNIRERFSKENRFYYN